MPLERISFFSGRVARSTLVRGVILTLVMPLFGGCGYVVIKRSELEKRTRIEIDSSNVVALRQRIAYLESRNHIDSVVRTAPDSLSPVARTKNMDSVVKVRDAEIVTLKEQLTKATDELERIKRRLAAPRQ